MSATHEDLYLLAEKAWSEADEKIIKLDAIGVIYQALLAERLNERIRMGMHVERMVREAVEAERKRCAMVAKKWKGHPADFHFAGRQIATAIREPKS